MVIWTRMCPFYYNSCDLSLSPYNTKMQRVMFCCIYCSVMCACAGNMLSVWSCPRTLYPRSMSATSVPTLQVCVTIHKHYLANIPHIIIRVLKVWEKAGKIETLSHSPPILKEPGKTKTKSSEVQESLITWSGKVKELFHFSKKSGTFFEMMIYIMKLKKYDFHVKNVMIIITFYKK